LLFDHLVGAAEAGERHGDPGAIRRPRARPRNFASWLLCQLMRKLVVDVLGKLAPAYPLVVNRSSAVMISFAITLQLLHS
jgi:hypothetical protein